MKYLLIIFPLVLMFGVLVPNAKAQCTILTTYDEHGGRTVRSECPARLIQPLVQHVHITVNNFPSTQRVYREEPVQETQTVRNSNIDFGVYRDPYNYSINPLRGLSYWVTYSRGRETVHIRQTGRRLNPSVQVYNRDRYYRSQRRPDYYPWFR